MHVHGHKQGQALRSKLDNACDAREVLFGMALSKARSLGAHLPSAGVA